MLVIKGGFTLQISMVFQPLTIFFLGAELLYSLGDTIFLLAGVYFCLLLY